jgi:hypothetical protein
MIQTVNVQHALLPEFMNPGALDLKREVQTFESENIVKIKLFCQAEILTCFVVP